MRIAQFHKTFQFSGNCPKNLSRGVRTNAAFLLSFFIVKGGFPDKGKSALLILLNLFRKLLNLFRKHRGAKNRYQAERCLVHKSFPLARLTLLQKRNVKPFV